MDFVHPQYHWSLLGGTLRMPDGNVPLFLWSEHPSANVAPGLHIFTIPPTFGEVIFMSLNPLPQKNGKDSKPSGQNAQYCAWTKSCTKLKPWKTSSLLVFPWESSFQGFLGGAKRISSVHSLGN